MIIAACLPIATSTLASLGSGSAGPDLEEQLIEFLSRPGNSWLGQPAVVYSLLAVTSALTLRAFWRVRTLSAARRVTVLGLCGGLALAAGLAFGIDVGLCVALGLTAQVTGGLAWSERCYALLGGGICQRVATAIAGVLLPLSLAVTLLAVREVLWDVVYQFQRMVAVDSSQYPYRLAPYFGVAIAVVTWAAIQQLRAWNCAQEWRVARETGEYPVPTTRPESTR